MFLRFVSCKSVVSMFYCDSICGIVDNDGRKGFVVVVRVDIGDG